MGELHLNGVVGTIAASGRVTAADVMRLRREVFGDGIVDRSEAEMLFAIDRACNEKSAEWNVFIAEAVTDYIVHQEKPAGYVSPDNANWLVRAMSTDGVIDTVNELEILVKVIETASAVPVELSALALKQVSVAVIDGAGALARSGELVRGRIGKAEVELLRRVLYGFGGDGNIAITRDEAEVLFELNDRTVEENNDPEWSDLFVKAVANFMMSASGYSVPNRTEALRREEWLNDPNVNVGGFFSRMFAGGLGGILDAYKRGEGLEAAHAANVRDRSQANEQASVIDHGEAEWLAGRIGRDGRLHANEKALLSFIRAESPSIHPALEELVSKVA